MNKGIEAHNCKLPHKRLRGTAKFAGIFTKSKLSQTAANLTSDLLHLKLKVEVSFFMFLLSLLLIT
jgi:hypothetical protein